MFVLEDVQGQDPGGEKAATSLRLAGAALLLAHLFLVAWLTLRPLEVAWVSAPNLHPTGGVRADFALGWSQGLRRVVRDFVMFAPLGFLLPLQSGRLRRSPVVSLLHTAAGGMLISVWFGLMRTYAPGQVTDIDTLILNITGVILVHLAVVPWGRAVLLRRLEDDPEGGTPRIARVGFSPWGEAGRRS